MLYDTVVNGAGINISSNFDPEPFASTITVSRNTLLRRKSEDNNNNQNDGAIWFNTIQGNDNNAVVLIKDNLVLNSSFQGISFSNRGKISNVTLDSNAIISSGSYGIDILKGVKGNVHDINSLILDMMLEPVNNGAPASVQLVSEIIQPQPASEPQEYSGRSADEAGQAEKAPVTDPLSLLQQSVVALAGGFIWIKEKTQIIC